MRKPHDVLVYDPAFARPVSITSWQRALVLYFFTQEVRAAAREGRIIRRVDEHGKGMSCIEVLAWQGDDDNPTLIRSGGGIEHLVPAVICLERPKARFGRTAKFSRKNIYSRDKGICQYCGRRVSESEAEREHVIPRAQGGSTCWENIVLACRGCNEMKGNRTPAQAGMRLLKQPVAPAPFSIPYDTNEWSKYIDNL